MPSLTAANHQRDGKIGCNSEISTRLTHFYARRDSAIPKIPIKLQRKVLNSAYPL
jgi:hypothetical protein